MHKHNFIFFIILLLVACGGGGGSSGEPKTVTVSWETNRESAVNTSGGGYEIYYSKTSNFDIEYAGVTVIDVPYVSGTTAPTSKSIELSPGTYYFKIVAYAEISQPGTGSPSRSDPSTQLKVVVP